MSDDDRTTAAREFIAATEYVNEDFPDAAWTWTDVRNMLSTLDEILTGKS